MRERNKKLLTLLGWVVFGAFVVIALVAVDWEGVLDALRDVRWGWLLLALVPNAAILLLWAGLWVLLTPRKQRIGYRRMLEISLMTSAAVNTFPTVAGHASGIALLERHGGIERSKALSIVSLDQLGRGLAKLATFLLLGLMVPLPGWIRPGIVVGSVVVGVLLVGLLWMSRRHGDDEDERSSSGSRLDRLKAFGARWASGLETLRSWKLSAAALSLALLMKAAEGLAIVAVQHAFGVDVSLATTVLVLGALSLVTFIPLTPANVGTYEASAFFAYRYMGVPEEQALPLALLQHLAFLVPASGAGYVVLVVRGVGWSRLLSHHR